MKKIIMILCSVMLCFTVGGCTSGSPSDSVNTAEISQNIGETSADDTKKEVTDSTPAISNESSTENGTDNSDSSNILVAYFSLADEQYEVGVIEKGNTEIIAEIIAEKTGADMFSISAAEAYPTTYEGLLEVSRQEENSPPVLSENIENAETYDIVFIGYPIWWGELPTIIEVFIESNDFSGKTIIPFCTHAGSGLSGTQSSIESLCDGAEIKDGLAVRGTTAQDDYAAAEKAVDDWLSEIGLS